MTKRIAKAGKLNTFEIFLLAKTEYILQNEHLTRIVWILI